MLTEERSRGGRYPATLLDRLLDDDRWPCKANLLTRAHDMDELVGDISTQSVYVTLPNPLLGVACVSARPVDAWSVTLPGATHRADVHAGPGRPTTPSWCTTG